MAPRALALALLAGAAAGADQPRSRPPLTDAGADTSQVRRQVQWAKRVLQQPQGRSAGPRRSAKGFGRILSPKQLGIPEVDPETFFSDHLLPRIPKSAGKQFIIDVGANKGQFARSIANWRQDGICFEPTPSVCKILKSNVAKMLGSPICCDIRVVCAVVGATSGINVSFATDASADASFHITAGGGGASSMSVPMVALDDVVPQDRNILLLKTDTQGFEMGVLQGAEKLLRQRRPQLLIVEMSYGLLGRAGTSPLKLMQKIDSYGYVCTQTQFFGRPHPGNRTRTGRIPWARQGVGYDESMTFQEMHDRLKSLPPNNIAGWTDLLCWPSDVASEPEALGSRSASASFSSSDATSRRREVAAELRKEFAEEGLALTPAEAAEDLTMRVQALAASATLLGFAVLCLRSRCRKERLLPSLATEDRP